MRFFSTVSICACAGWPCMSGTGSSVKSCCVMVMSTGPGVAAPEVGRLTFGSAASPRTPRTSSSHLPPAGSRTTTSRFGASRMGSEMPEEYLRRRHRGAGNLRVVGHVGCGDFRVVGQAVGEDVRLRAGRDDGGAELRGVGGELAAR